MVPCPKRDYNLGKRRSLCLNAVKRTLYHLAKTAGLNTSLKCVQLSSTLQFFLPGPEPKPLEASYFESKDLSFELEL